MANFHKTILKAISDYKLILRKTLPSNKCSAKLHELGIKRKYIVGIDEVGLYKIGLKIISELKGYTASYKGKRTTNCYLGAERFLEYLDELFVEYKVENNQVIHIGQKSSTALLNAIQLITLNKDKITGNILREIKKYSEIVIRYGTKEQKKMLVSALGSDNGHLVSSLE